MKYFFRDKTTKYDPSKKTFTEKSKWTPNLTQIPQEALGTISKINKAYTSVIKSAQTLQSSRYSQNGGEGDLIKLHEKPNLSKNEIMALKNLSNLKDIIIKPADKGGATVLMDKSNYIAEALRQLNDPKYYQKIREPISKNNVPKIHKILQDLQNLGYISKKQQEYLSGPEEYKTRTFYLLPKIHKNSKTWTIPDKMPQGRPIVSDTNSESYRVSQYIDSFLNPLASKHKSYLKNTFDFVNKIRNKRIPSSHFIVTGDVTSLYTNMDINRTLECVRKVLHEAPAKMKIPTKCLMNLLELTMKNNDFEFNGDFFLQICGTAMGKIYAPSLANIYLLDFDEAAMTRFKINPDYYYRYLDDIFFIWGGSLEELKEFETFLNNLIPGIKITLEYSQTEMNFLDTTVFKEPTDHASECLLQTKVFFKPTDTHQLLHMTSHHPKHTTKGILKSQLIRFRRISANKKEYEKTCKTLFHYLKNRGYSYTTMREQKNNIWNNYKEKNENNAPLGKDKTEPTLPIINMNNKIGISLTRKYKEIIKTDPLLGTNKIIAAYRNPKNLYQVLIRSKLNSETNPYTSTPDTLEPAAGFRQCTSTQCSLCKIHSTNNKTFRSTHYNSTFNLTQSLSCATTNIVYLITCRKCNIQYVGETSRNLTQRLTDHRSNVKTKKITPISLHFNSPGHSPYDIFAIPIEKIRNNNVTARRQREQFWQKKLGTKKPWGLNDIIEA